MPKRDEIYRGKLLDLGVWVYGKLQQVGPCRLDKMGNKIEEVPFQIIDYDFLERGSAPCVTMCQTMCQIEHFKEEQYEYENTDWIVDPESIGKYIAQSGENGRIFEGDILFSKDEVGFVIWSKELNRPLIDCGDYFIDPGHSINWKMYRIIGNMTDNPDLLNIIVCKGKCSYCGQILKREHFKKGSYKFCSEDCAEMAWQDWAGRYERGVIGEV